MMMSVYSRADTHRGTEYMQLSALDFVLSCLQKIFHVVLRPPILAGIYFAVLVYQTLSAVSSRPQTGDKALSSLTYGQTIIKMNTPACMKASSSAEASQHSSFGKFISNTLPDLLQFFSRSLHYRLRNPFLATVTPGGTCQC